MKVHLKILILTLVILLGGPIIIYLLFTKQSLEKYQIILSIIYFIFVIFYPAGFYTAWRIVAENDRSGNLLSKMMINSSDKIPGLSLFLFPLMISPLLFINIYYI